jgi:hypothetical protein
MAANDNRWTVIAAEMEQVHPLVADRALTFFEAMIAAAKRPDSLYPLVGTLDRARDDLEPLEIELSPGMSPDAWAALQEAFEALDWAMQVINRARKLVGRG